MKDFLRFTYIEPFQDMGLVGICFGIFIWIISLGLVTLGAGGIFYGCINVPAESSFRPGTAVVDQVTFVPAHVTHGGYFVGKVWVPTTRHRPDRWEAHGLIDSKTRFRLDFTSEVKPGLTFNCRWAKRPYTDDIVVRME